MITPPRNKGKFLVEPTWNDPASFACEASALPLELRPLMGTIGETTYLTLRSCAAVHLDGSAGPPEIESGLPRPLRNGRAIRSNVASSVPEFL